MPDLQHQPLRARKLEQRIGFGQRARQRLLDQHVHARLQAGAHDLVVLLRGYRDAGGIQAGEMRRQHRPVVGRVFAAEGIAELRRARGIGVDDGDQLRRGAGGKLLGVEPAHVADADHCDAGFSHGS